MHCAPLGSPVLSDQSGFPIDEIHRGHATFHGAAVRFTRSGRATLLPEQATESWTPFSEAEKGAIQQQLEQLLSSPLFHSSKRYPSFLRFVVARVLAGQTDQLKERILGVEIFGRPADYDTNADPIVRVTAAEIRKRIEQYYHDPKHVQEIRFSLPSGSYAPSFPGPDILWVWWERQQTCQGTVRIQPYFRPLPVHQPPQGSHPRGESWFLRLL